VNAPGRPAAAILAGLGGLTVLGYVAWGGLGAAPREAYRVLFSGLFALYGLACYLVLRRGARRPPPALLVLILGVAALSRGILVFTMPYLSDDIYRYIWDGRVQAAGLSPYAYPPAAPEVARLHPPGDPIWPGINRKPAITIYPPGAELFYAAIYRLRPDSLTATKAVLVAVDLLSCGVLLALLGALGLPRTRVLIYAWAPLPIVEFGSSGHIEALAVLLILLALLAGVWAGRRPGADSPPPRAGWALAALAALAAAALVQLVPLLLLAGWVRRFGGRLIAWAGGVFTLGYLGFVVANGGTLPIFLLTYLRDEYINAPLYALLGQGLAPRLGVPDLVVRAALLAGLGLIALGIAAWRDWSPTAFIGKSFLLTGAYLLLATNAHPWYATGLLLFVPLFLPPGGLPLGPLPAGGAGRRLPALVVAGAWLYTGLTIWGGYPGS